MALRPDLAVGLPFRRTFSETHICETEAVHRPRAGGVLTPIHVKHVSENRRVKKTEAFFLKDNRRGRENRIGIARDPCLRSLFAILVCDPRLRSCCRA